MDALTFSSSTDIISASQDLEKAINSSSKYNLLKYLNKARTHLYYAKDHLEYGNLPQENSLLNNLNDVMKEFSALIRQAEDIKTKQLSDFQQTNLYAFQGVLGALYEMLKPVSISA